MLIKVELQLFHFRNPSQVPLKISIFTKIQKIINFEIKPDQFQKIDHVMDRDRGGRDFEGSLNFGKTRIPAVKVLFITNRIQVFDRNISSIGGSTLNDSAELHMKKCITLMCVKRKRITSSSLK